LLLKKYRFQFDPSIPRLDLDLRRSVSGYIPGPSTAQLPASEETGEMITECRLSSGKIATGTSKPQ
jgi:hypothetical protein